MILVFNISIFLRDHYVYVKFWHTAFFLKGVRVFRIQVKNVFFMFLILKRFTDFYLHCVDLLYYTINQQTGLNI